ncbi:MLO-like protein 6 [Senna tora]|uniref:MLO-like protein 6 n=1 Tax=Senna tora TaxID=362788 RepID=A0A834XC43_9FABA|nr:MLO-like protein 6 [Senna tora]
MFIECEIQLYVKEKMVIDYGSHVLHNELAQILNGMVTVVSTFHVLSSWLICSIGVKFISLIMSLKVKGAIDYVPELLSWRMGPQSYENFDFQKCINRSLEDDFKGVLGISFSLWIFLEHFKILNKI